MTIAERIELITQLPLCWSDDCNEWENTKRAAQVANAWFTQEYIDKAVGNITQQFLSLDLLNNWVTHYPQLYEKQAINKEKTIGIVMAGNLPLVGFHDFLCCFVGGYSLNIKLSSKDTVLWNYIINYLSSLDNRFSDIVRVSPMLKDCYGYIATGSNNSARYFEQYFQKYPHIIRKNRTSIAVLTGKETVEELTSLSNSMHDYFGMGCRNVSKIFVPNNYDFEYFIQHTKGHLWQRDHNKYKNNYDFQLAMFILNKVPYMSNEAMLFVENKELFAPISVVNYSYYDDLNSIKDTLNEIESLQCIEAAPFISSNLQEMTKVPVINLGESQQPSLMQYADHVDTMAFLESL